MADTFRALCAELTVWAEKTSAGREPAAPPADGEVAEFAAWLRETGDTIQPSHLAEHQRYKRAAELLQRQAPQPPADGEVAELAAKLRRLAPQNPLGTADPTITRAAELLERQCLDPLPARAAAVPQAEGQHHQQGSPGQLAG